MSGSSIDQHVVEVVDGAVAIDGRPILRGVNLSINAGEFAGLMGANGSGKSTLVRAMTGLRDVVAGEVRLFGTPLARFRDWHRVGFAPQRAGAGSGVPASVWEVVAAGRLARRRLLRPLGRSDRSAIREALEVVGLAEREQDSISVLSGGQQQRVLIARALAGEPELLLLDEPMAGVDLPNQQALADALGTLSQRSVTVVLVAHELGPIAPLMHRAIVMRDGRVAYDGAPLTDAEVHTPHFGEPTAYLSGESHAHHHPQRSHADHVPHVAAPLDTDPGGTS